MTTPTLTRSNRTDLWLTVSVGAVAAAYVVVGLVVRLVEIFGGGAISVPVQIAPTEVPIPGTSSTSGATMNVDQGVVSVSGLPVGTFASVLLAAILPAVASLIVIGCAIVVFRRVLAGQPFAPGTARLVTIASFAILGGWVASTLFDTMASNGALALADPGNIDGVGVQVSYLPFLASLAVAALAVQFRSGEKLNRDTEGLV